MDEQQVIRALAALAPQRPGTVDAYVLTIALDSDPVFAREAREAARVLAARYGAGGRTLTLAGPDGNRDDAPHGSISGLRLALAHLGNVMDGVAPVKAILDRYNEVMAMWGDPDADFEKVGALQAEQGVGDDGERGDQHHDHQANAELFAEQLCE